MKHKKPVANNEGRIVNPDQMSDLEIEAEASRILGKAGIEAGTFYDEVESVEFPRLTPPAPKDYSPEFYEGSIRMYREFARVFGEPRSVFYPACYVDASPIRGFPNSEVILLDRDDFAAQVMQNAGIPLLHMPIEQYHGKKHDLIILFNQMFHPSLAIPFLERGGKIIANNYHHTASDLRDMGHPILGVFDGDDRYVSIEQASEELRSAGGTYVIGGK